MKRAMTDLWKIQHVTHVRTCNTWNNNANTARKGYFILRIIRLIMCIIAIVMLTISAGLAQLLTPDDERFTPEAARRMINASQELLSPGYNPLAKQIVADYDLADKAFGIGIDLGSGPGKLIVELCRYTRIHWINADINPHFFAHFYAEADKQGFANRVSAIFADAQALPFRDNYADIIVSRGSYHLWEDKLMAFSEIMRVLKPGGVAYIGRGFARDMPVDIARSIRAKQSGIIDFDPHVKAGELKKLCEKLQIEKFRIEIPGPPNAEDVNYGIWIELRAPCIR